MKKKLGIAFCGAGRIVNDYHLPKTRQRADCYVVKGVFDVAPGKATQAATGEEVVYQSYDDLLADTLVDVVVIATQPLNTHYPAALRALEAGKHVVVEKPMATTTQECDALIAAAAQANRILTVHQNRRLDLDFLALQDVLRKGKIGEPRLIVSSVVRNDGYEGGDVIDWAVHLVDQMLLVNRSPLVEVSAFLAKPDGGMADGGFFEATFRFEKLPVTRVSMMPRTKEFLLNGTPPSVRFYAAGTQGAFSQRTIEVPNDLMNATQEFEQWTPEYAVPDYLQITRREFYDYLYDSLAEDAPLLVKPAEARNNIRALELAAESASLGRSVSATNMLNSL